MSSPARVSTAQSATGATATTTTSSSDTTTKKKFGKNLNKLTAPPVVNTTQGNNKSSSSSKNGFLLLSTKRTAATASGGILSSKSAQNSLKPIPNLGLHTEFTSSTHDALLGVVVGASRVESQQQPDAWGVAEKQQQEQSQQTKVQSSKEQPASLPTGSKDVPSYDGDTNTSVKATKDKSSVREIEHQNAQEKDSGQNNAGSAQAGFRTSNWDEYGGRNLETKDDNISDEARGNNSSNDDQGAIMMKLARQRAEKKRNEEQKRMFEQKERAAQRLRELDEKMAMKKNEKSEKEIEYQSAESNSRSKIVLEKLKNREDETAPLSTTPIRTQRTLYDPNAPGKSYSSLVAGSPSAKQERTSKSIDQCTKQQSSAVAPAKKNGGTSQQGTYSADPESFDRKSFIQLASYEDRDRGDRNASAAPRMLFDPKSGSMVEVTSRDEGGMGGKNRKLGKKSKSSRDKQSKKDLPNDSGNVDSKGRRKFKGGKEINSTNNRAKGGSEPSSTSKHDKRLKIADARKLPRTCGVLYSRDKKGGFYCVDGCEGDLGYGVHSVPGGRIKNSEAYLKYQQLSEDMASYDAVNNGNLTLATGFHITDVKEPVHEWIKPNEKIELITGDNESPTLQATAREWAPSHTAFALPERENMGVSSARSVDEDEDKEEDLVEEDDDAPVSILFRFSMSLSLPLRVKSFLLSFLLSL